MAFRPAIFDGDVLALEIANLAQAAAKCADNRGRLIWRSTAKEPDHWHCGLLRARSARPPSHRTAKKRDELAPPHSITLVGRRIKLSIMCARKESRAGVPRTCG